VKVRVLGGVREVPQAAWDALAGDASPFVGWTWLATLEDAGTVTRATGWLPQHLTLWEGAELVGACPLYVKGHSLGEFVFDHGWAAAAARAGIEYYPKLLVAAPFTPATGPRFLAAPGARATVIDVLGGALEALCEQHRFSSAHVNFCQPVEVETLGTRGWLRRTGYQYHWTNPGFRTFDDYLESLRSKRRNQVRREQRELGEQGVEIAVHHGPDLPADLRAALYPLYETTLERFGPLGHRYLTRRFFELIVERFGPHVCCIVARRRGEIVAGTFNVQYGDALYGRYWGAFHELRHLHFNVCYYAPIAHCIAAGLARFEPGAGGEFKQMRGFDATPTDSMHFVQEPGFRAAVADYLRRERGAVAREIASLQEETALRRDRPPAGRRPGS
jgi:predicted N-acyltransferase